MNQEFDLETCWIKVEETDTEIKVMVNPKVGVRRALPFAYMLGTNMLIYPKRKTEATKVKP